MKTLFWSNVKKTCPVWSVWCLVGMFICHMKVADFPKKNVFDWGSHIYIGMQEIFFFSLYSYVFALGIAVLVFSYLNSTKANSFYSSLPFSKTGLFVRTYISGLLIILITDFLIFSSAAVVSVYMGSNRFYELLIGVLTTTLTSVMYYSLAVFCIQIMGMVISSIALFICFIYSGSVVTIIIEKIAQITRTGRNVLREFLPEFISNLSLNKWLSSQMNVDGFWTYRLGSNGEKFAEMRKAVEVCLILTLISVVIFIISTVVNYHRKAENIGDVVAIKKARPLLAGLASMIIALYLAVQLVTGFFGETECADRFGWFVALFTIVLAVFLFVVYQAVWMLIQREIKISKNHLIKGMVFAGAFALVSGGIKDIVM